MKQFSQQDISPTLKWVYYTQVFLIAFLQFADIPIWIPALGFLILIWNVLQRLRVAPEPNWTQLAVIFCGILATTLFVGEQYVTLVKFQTILTSAVIFLHTKPLNFTRIHFNCIILFWTLGSKIISHGGIWVTIFSFIEIFILLLIIIRVNQLDSEGQTFLKSIRSLMRSFFQSLPILIGLFVMIPSMIDGSSGPTPRVSKIGFDDKLSPGDVSQLISESGTAFRVYMGKDIPPMLDLYWRGSVLEYSDGMKWRSSIWGGRRQNLRQSSLAGGIHQTIERSGSLGQPLFGLNAPLSTSIGVSSGKIEASKALTYRLDKPPYEWITYEVVSTIHQKWSAFDSPTKKTLQTPANVKEEILIKVNQTIKGSKSQKEAARRLLKIFSEEKFEYSLSPPRLRNQTLAEFFRVKVGFCEHYAAAYASLLRIAGIHSRVVLGFHGGELNPFGHFVTVDNRDAHAWVEAHFDGDSGWTLIDPTGSIAPSRVMNGGQYFHSYQSWIGRFSFLSDDLVKSLWSLRQYAHGILEWSKAIWLSLEKTYEFWLNESLIADFDPKYAILVVMVVLYMFIRRTQRNTRTAPCHKIYLKYQKTLKPFGFNRRVHEAPKEHLERIISQGAPLPDLQREFVEQWLHAHYGPHDPTPTTLKKLKRDLKLLKEGLEASRAT